MCGLLAVVVVDERGVEVELAEFAAPELWCGYLAGLVSDTVMVPSEAVCSITTSVESLTVVLCSLEKKSPPSMCAT